MSSTPCFPQAALNSFASFIGSKETKTHIREKHKLGTRPKSRPTLYLILKWMLLGLHQLYWAHFEFRHPNRAQNLGQPAGTNSNLEGVLEPLARDEHPQAANTCMEKVNPDSSKGAKSANSSSKRKKAKYQTAVVRRSDRLQNIIRPASKQDVEPVIEDITLSDSDQEDDQEGVREEDQEDEQHAHMQEELPEPILCEKNMEEKIDYIVELLESIENSIETLNFKNESLTEENHQLSKQLEVARAKLEVYEKGPFWFSELMEKLKDAIVVGNLTRATETVVNILSGVGHNALPSQDVVREPGTAAKRKRGKQRKI
ncbi:hypothetical protein FNV43_RR23394 [Rhamnella rubrinervis]|uniref:Uncharacterized protein n=1 Tax=Rhamnella rubrinervis TaxID=2594499 RepID=A0A8K0GP42_9ROSA|nr:hypothetical protein FNV43_RR23394 [Rhamnella rubrinervis]